MLSPAPSFASSTEVFADRPVSPAPVSPSFSSGSGTVPQADFADANPPADSAPPSVSYAEPSVNRGGRGRGRGAPKAKGQAKSRSRTRTEIPLTAEQLEAMESTLPAAGTFLGTSTHGNFQIRTARIALTYARCPIPVEDCFRQLASVSSTIKGMRGVVEPHRDGTPHVHIIVQKSNTAIPYRNLILEEGGILYRCDVRTLSTKKYQVNWHQYCAKHSDPSHWGDYQVPCLKLTKSSVELVATAVSAGIPEALQDFIEGGGGLQHVQAVRRGLEIMTAPEATTRFVPPPIVYYSSPMATVPLDRAQQDADCSQNLLGMGGAQVRENYVYPVLGARVRRRDR